MIYLLLSVLLNAYIGIAFAFFNRYKIDLFQAIVFNYAVCVITGSMVTGNFPVNAELIREPYFKWAILMGALFIGVFNLIAISSVKAGVTVTQTANKLSLVIPVVFAYFLYQERISVIKFFGIAIALSAVLLISYKSKKEKGAKRSAWEYALPLILFFSSGIIDTLTKYAQYNFLHSETLSNNYLISGFFTAFIIGFIVLVYLYLSGKKTFHIRNVFAGIILGIPNYFSIYYLVKALQCKSLSSSATIPINNIAVLFLVSIFGIFIFKESLSKYNFAGLALTILAIILIFLGDQF